MSIHAAFLAVIVLSMTAYSQTTIPVTPGVNDGVYQVRYLANLNVADSYVNITNVGALSGLDPAGRIWAYVFVFDPNEEPVSCSITWQCEFSYLTPLPIWLQM